MKPPVPALNPHSPVEWGATQLPLEGEAVCGDRHLVCPLPDGCLFAVVDGLGHGVEAAAAAEAAVSVLENEAQEPVIRLVEHCHRALRQTRGVAIIVAALNARYGTITWLGVGNVEGVLVRADKQGSPPQESVMQFPGVAGHRLPPLRAMVTPIYAGDLLYLFTDGIQRDFLSEPPIPGHSAQRIADRICMRYHKVTDDALILVARYTGART